MKKHRNQIAASVRQSMFIYGGYLAIFYAVWAITKVDYTAIGRDEGTIFLWYALPTLCGSSFVIAAVSILKQWKVALFEPSRVGPTWTNILPLAMLAAIALNFSATNTANITPELLLWSLLGGVGVGIGEEIITRGSLLVSLRQRFAEEKVWLYTTLAFSALHIPNVFFGLSFVQMLLQLIIAFIMGSAFYAMRRTTGTLLVPIILHGLWDTSIFLPQATGGSPNGIAALIYPLAIICAAAVIKRNKQQPLD